MKPLGVTPEMVFIDSGDDTSMNNNERYFVGQHSSSVLMYIFKPKEEGNKHVSLLKKFLEK